MASEAHPAATQHLPFFITPPGSTDVLYVITTIVLVGAVLGIGVLFLWLHSLPERMAHKSQKIQFELVALLCLLALFTHEHLFWFAAIILAFIDVPDFGTPMRRMAAALERLAWGDKAPPPPPAEQEAEREHPAAHGG